MSQTRETVTEKRTVIKSSSGHLDDLGDSISFKSSISPRRSNVIQRSSFTGPGVRSSMGGGSGGTVYTRTVEYGYGSQMGGSLGPGGYENVSKTGVSNVKSEREREKKDMQELNERFANYIEKVRFLEAQNRKLASELETLRDKWGKETSAVKQMYEAELAEARKLIDDLQREKSNLEIKNQSLQEQMQDMQRQLDDAKRYRQIDRETIDKLNQQLSDAEAEISLLRRSVSSLETDRTRDRDRINQLQAEVDKLRIDLNNETLNHLDAENRRQTLEEEIEFLKKVHEQELKELAALAYRDTTEENREFWKSELAQAIRDIQKEYDSKLEHIRGDMEGFYNLKIQEFRTGATKQNMEVTHVKEENKKLIKTMSDLKGRLADLEARNAQLEKQYQDLLREYESIESEHTMETNRLKEEITSLRAEMENILQELQTIMDTKLSLELEIAAYRKLLECEESRSYLSMQKTSTTGPRDLITIEHGLGERVEDKLSSHSLTTMGGGVVSSQSDGGIQLRSSTTGANIANTSVISSSRVSGDEVITTVRKAVTSSSSLSGGGSGRGGYVESLEAGGAESMLGLTMTGSSSGSMSDLIQHAGQIQGSISSSSSLTAQSGDSSMSVKMMRGEVSAKTTYQRTSTGPISISDVSPEGKYIKIENTSSGANRREVDLDGWKMKRIVDGKRDYIYPFRNVTLKPGKSLKIFARGSAADAGMNDLIFRDEDSWGVGSQVVTSLVNKEDDEKATHTQKTLYN